VAGLIFSRQARGQFAAIAFVRWRLFVNSLRTIRGRLELVSRGLIFLGFATLGLGGSLAMGAGACYFASHGRAELLALLLWPVFLFWQLFPVMASAFTENVDSSNLLRFPLSFPSYFLIRIAYGSLDPAMAVGGLWLLGMAIGIGVARPAYFVVALAILLLFAIFNILLGQMIFTWVERWLARRRSREILGVVFLVVIISFQFVGPFMRHFGPALGPAVTHVTAQALPIERMLPPGLAAAAVARALQGEYILALSAFALSGAYALAVGWLLTVRLRAQYLGENLSEAVARAARPGAKQKIQVGWNIEGVPGSVSAVVEKEFRYLSRSGPMLFTLVMPVVVLLIFRFTPGKSDNPGGILAHASDLAFPVGAGYALLILSNLVYNCFGPDAAGIQFFFVSPVRFREILLGKNLAAGFVLAAEIVLVWLATCLMYRPPSWDVVLATVTGVFFALLLNLIGGNFLAVFAPKKVDLGAFGRQRASNITAFASLGIQAAVVGLCALALLVARAYQHIWVAAIIFVFLAAGALAAYFLVLDRMDAIILKRREVMIAELCKA
jgi:ABC-2 type transport system permease protein